MRSSITSAGGLNVLVRTPIVSSHLVPFLALHSLLIKALGSRLTEAKDTEPNPTIYKQASQKFQHEARWAP